mgnify:CR=1 FL=1
MKPVWRRSELAASLYAVMHILWRFLEFGEPLHRVVSRRPLTHISRVVACYNCPTEPCNSCGAALRWLHPCMR